jgi:hypothetical protein
MEPNEDDERAARERYEAGLPMLSEIGEYPAEPGTIWDAPVAELTIALVDEHGHVRAPDGAGEEEAAAPVVRALLGITYTDGEYAEQIVEGVSDLPGLLRRLLDGYPTSR